jgi:hypothetical protein
LISPTGTTPGLAETGPDTSHIALSRTKRRRSGPAIRRMPERTPRPDVRIAGVIMNTRDHPPRSVVRIRRATSAETKNDTPQDTKTAACVPSRLQPQRASTSIKTIGIALGPAAASTQRRSGNDRCRVRSMDISAAASVFQLTMYRYAPKARMRASQRSRVKVSPSAQPPSSSTVPSRATSIIAKGATACGGDRTARRLNHAGDASKPWNGPPCPWGTASPYHRGISRTIKAGPGDDPGLSPSGDRG